MTNGILALFGLGAGELLILLAVLGLGFMLIVGAATVVSYFVIRFLARKSETPTTATSHH